MSEGFMPEGFELHVVEVAGTTRDCGRMLGERWRAALRASSDKRRGEEQWWRRPIFQGLIKTHAPHVPELYAGMAEGAGIATAELIAPVPSDLSAGCTSFAVAPDATRDGRLICGQTKDAPTERTRRNVILKLSPSDAPPALTMTYPGMLFGHGFVAGGCAIFRNSICVNPVPTRDALPYDAWGLLALHCKTVDDVCALTEGRPVTEHFHCTVCDTRGGIVGIEHADGESAFLRPMAGLYTHANNINSGGALLAREACDEDFRKHSQHRRDRLMHRLRESGRRSTIETVHQALCDHDGHPFGVCNHESERFCTTAALVAEPARGSLLISTGPPCRNAPKEFRLG
jgi:isopenicillin-N N-acyltransferase-like protein